MGNEYVDNKEALRIDMRHVSVTGMSPMMCHNSASRNVMFASMLAQALTLDTPQLPRILTGLEKEYAENLLNKKIDGEIKILAFLKKWDNSELMFYQDINTNTLNTIVIPEYESLYRYYGFEHTKTDLYNSLELNDLVCDPVLTTTNNDKDGLYSFGAPANVLLTNVNEIGEDAIVASETGMEMLAYTEYHTYEFSANHNEVFINAYGDDEHYQPFPLIGEQVREDKLLCAIRKYTEDNYVTLFNNKALQRNDVVFDNCTFATRTGEVVSLEVIYRDGSQKIKTYTKAYDLIKALSKEQEAFYNNVISITDRLMKENDNMLTVGGDLQTLYLHGNALTNKKYNLTDKFTPVYASIKITVKTRVVPTVEYKITDLHGGKGIVSYVLPDEMMPVTEDGLRAHFIMGSQSTGDRNNPGRLIEGYLASTTVILNNKIKQLLIDGKRDMVKDILLRFYKIVSPVLHDQLLDIDDDDLEEFYHILADDGLRIQRNGSDIDNVTVIDRLQQSEFKREPQRLVIPVTHDKTVMTDSPIMMNTMYIMLLNKTPGKSHVCDTPNLNHLGVAPTMSKQAKAKLPYYNSAGKFLAEPETKILTTYAKPELIAEFRDRMVRPETQYMMTKNIMQSGDRSNMKEVINRRVHRYDAGMPLEILNALLRTSGTEVKFKKEER